MAESEMDVEKMKKKLEAIDLDELYTDAKSRGFSIETTMNIMFDDVINTKILGEIAYSQLEKNKAINIRDILETAVKDPKVTEMSKIYGNVTETYNSINQLMNLGLIIQEHNGNIMIPESKLKGLLIMQLMICEDYNPHKD